MSAAVLTTDRPRHVHVNVVRAIAMAAAALPYVGSEARAIELSRNVAVPASEGDDVYQCAVEAIRHRETCFALWCSDRHACARAMARAWAVSERWVR